MVALKSISVLETDEEIVAVGATFAIALGCLSPATQTLSLTNTDTSRIISYLANATSFNETQFQHPDLPDSWSWGFSGTVSNPSKLNPPTLTDEFLGVGTCELYIDPSKDMKCYYAFPPLFSIQDLVAKALSRTNDSDTAAVIATWNTALAQKPSDPAFSALAKSDSQRKRSISLFRGGAAAIVFSLLISLTTLFCSFTLFSRRIEEKPEREFRHILYGVAVFDFLMFAGALACFTFGVVIGPAALASGQSGTVTAGFEVGSILLLAALLCRIVSIPIIGVVVFCILGFELVCILFMGYWMLKCFGALVEDHQPVGMY
jgi:hypothetical protein